MNRLLAPWRALTLRGRCFLMFGAAVVAAAMKFGQRDLASLGVLLLLLPLLALLVLWRLNVALDLQREVDPPRTWLGGRLTARLHLSKPGSLPMGRLQFEDTVPPQLGRRPRFTVHKVAGAWQREISYPLMGLARGRHAVGPLTVRASDPFGMASIQRALGGTHDVLVTPQVEPLGPMHTQGGAGTTGETAPQRIGRTGQDDVLVREYRSGDDVRRVHWRSTARWGELMVRREEQAWEPSALVLLDNRATRHFGTGRTSSFEWTVSGAASVCQHFALAGYRVTLTDAPGEVVQGDASDPLASREAHLVALAQATTSMTESLATSLRQASLRDGDVLVALLGRVDDEDVALLTHALHNRAQGFAFLVESDSFVGQPLVHPAMHRRAIQVLREQGWRVVPVRDGVSVAQAWTLLDREVAA